MLKTELEDRHFSSNCYSLNVKGIRDACKRERVFAWCKDKKADIVFLQETYSTADVEDRWCSMWDGSCYFSHGTNHSKGVMVLFNSHLDIQVEEIREGKDGRYILIRCTIFGVKIVLCNVYFPVRNKEIEQINMLQELTREINSIINEDCLVIMGGDFNMIRNFELDYMGHCQDQRHNRVLIKFEEFMDRFNLIDIWRERNPLRRQFSYRQNKPLVQSRLDYWMISSKLKEITTKCEIIPSVAPDHSAINLFLFNKKNNVMKNFSYWKFNNSLCNDKLYIDQMKTNIQIWKKELSSEIKDKRVLWDFMKMKIRSFTQDYSKRIAKERRQKIEVLEKEVQDLEKQLVGCANDSLVERLELKRKELQNCYDYINQGLKVRSRASWYENGERNPQFFNQLLKSNKNKSVIRKLYVNGDEISHDGREILKQINLFYSRLYTRVEVSMSNLDFLPHTLPKLSDDSKKLCEGTIVERECLNALDQMMLNKSPGNDGLSVEFYKTFWPVIGDMVIASLNEAFQIGELAASQKQAVITLIKKEGKDPLLIKNYRPISLLNVDYKILAKILSKRVKNVLDELISPDQVGYIKNRNIGEAIRLIDDMIFHTSINNVPGFLVAVDFEKAFDSVSHVFLQNVLQAFGFGASFRKWIKILYTNTVSCVLNGGYSTGYFNVERGVRQGDPLSPYLFILCVETLAKVIQNDNLVLGLRFNGTEVKQVLYADDITLFIQDLDSMSRLDVIFKSFAKVSGLKVNTEKTYIMLLGSSQGSICTFPFGKMVPFVKILGVYFSLDVQVKENMNYKEILSKIKKSLSWWSQRDLTLMGKIQLLKTYIYSKLLFIASLTPIPHSVLGELDKMAFNFLWKGSDKIKRTTMFQEYNNGGLKMMNFELMVKVQRIMWVKRLLYGDQQMKWKLYFDYITRHVGGKFIFSCNYEMRMFRLALPTFYEELLHTWLEVRDLRQVDGNYKGNEIIFNNKHICFRGFPFYHGDLISKGVFKLQHILDEDGKLRKDSYFTARNLSSWNLIQIKHIYEKIPSIWKTQMYVNEIKKKELDREDIVLALQSKIVPLQEVPSKKLYLTILNSKFELPSVFKKIKEIYNFSDKDIEAIFLRPRKCTLNSKLREFQFKLLHEIIYTNYELWRFGLAPSKLCSFCKQTQESYRHLFYECDKVKLLWKSVGNYLNLPTLRELSWEEILFGVDKGKGGKTYLLNHIILLMKYMIHQSRKKNIPPNLAEIKEILKGNQEEEKKIALERNTLSIHLRKWEAFDVR